MLSVAQENERFWSVEDGNVFNLLIYIFFSDGSDLENTTMASIGTDLNCQSLTGRGQDRPAEKINFRHVDYQFVSVFMHDENVKFFSSKIFDLEVVMLIEAENAG